MKTASSPLSRIVTCDQVPEAGLEVDIAVSAGELAALAGFLGIPAVAALSAHLTVTRWRARGLAVRGRLVARVGQTCVVTLEPVENVVEEEVEAFFAPESDRREPPEAAYHLEAAEADVEPLVDGRVDLGALVTEHLALGLDPYPRKPGVVFEEGRGDADAGHGAGPFAALAPLRKNRRKQ